MGRKKRKSDDATRRQPIMSAASVGVSGGLQIEGGTSEDHPADATLANEMPASSPSSVQSSWFPEVKWVARCGDDLQTSDPSAAPVSQASLPDDGETSRETVHVSSSTQSITLPADLQHASLVAELNRLKNQLMPSARACADAINERQSAQTTPEYEFRQARSICNPFERLGETFSKNHIKRKRKQFSKQKHQQSTSGLSQFVNRSAIKLANIDSLLGFCLTPTIPEPQSARDANEPFVFADLCGAPGGFSEYILYRHVHPAVLPDAQKGDNSNNKDRRRIYGFGMSLSGANEDGKGVPWNLAHMERFRLPSDDASNATGGVNGKLQYQVCTGKDGTGSIYNWDNVLQLQREMVALVSEKEADGRDCHNPLANLVVADGGFDAQRDSNNQEAVAHKIIASQTAAALTLLRPGGSFVLKIFGCQEMATRRTLRHLFGRFDRLTFVKPVLSRPASAERYLVCLGYTGPPAGWDGLLWREKMLDTAQKCDDELTDDGRDRLEELMDSFDIDMLRLNIDTCGSIIKYMDAKRELVHQGHGATALVRTEHRLDLQEYEAAWQLHAPRQTGE